MADFTASDRQAAAQALAEVLTADVTPAAVRRSSPNRSSKMQRALLQSWPVAKPVLEALKGLLAGSIRWALDLIISVGDKLYGSVCPKTI